MSTQIEIHALIRDRESIVDLSVSRILTELSVFLVSVQSHGFVGACERLLGDDVPVEEPVAAIEQIVLRLEGGTCPGVFNKALQETFLDACGIEHDPQLRNFDPNIRGFLTRAKPDGFIARFLGLYVFHSLWISIQDDLRLHCRTEDAFLSSRASLRSLSQDAVMEAIKESIGDRELGDAVGHGNSGAQILARVQSRMTSNTIEATEV